MYAVVTTGGKQYRVAEGDVLRVEKIDAPVGDTVELDKVNLLAKGDGVVVDPSALTGATVLCEVVEQDRAKKIRVFKFKRRKNYHRTQGHRQHYTALKVREIKA
ncbi:MAG: 50S ribosomal protein L21 [Candidatus Hydrogenedentota bacterium]